MSTAPIRFPYVVRDPTLGPVGFAPLLPINLSFGSAAIDVFGLLDTGAAVNVMPYSVGLSLGYDWDREPPVGPLAGTLVATAAKGVVATARVGPLAPVSLAFAWVETDETPVLLGQMNFFLEFDVSFHRSRLQFELQPAAKPTP